MLCLEASFIIPYFITFNLQYSYSTFIQHMDNYWFKQRHYKIEMSLTIKGISGKLFSIM